MTDTYEFEKSQIPQGVNYETPYVSSNYNYIPDINGGVYQSGGLSLVTFDLTSIYSSQMLIDPAKCFLTLPIVLCSALVTDTTTGALLAPVANYGWSYAGLKAGYWNLVHQADITINGKIIEQTQPFLNIYTNVKMMSQMSQDDLRSFGSSIGLGSVLDNFQSLKLNSYTNQTATTATTNYPPNATNLAINYLTGGNGLVNNQPFPIAGSNTTPNEGDQPTIGLEFSNCYNNGYYSRLITVVDTSVAVATTGQCGLYGTNGSTGSTVNNIQTATQLVNEFRNYFAIVNTNYSVSYYTAIIRLCDIFDSFKNLPLCKRLDGTLRIYVNTGAVGTFIQTVTNVGQMITSQSSNTFTATCPLIQSCLGQTAYGNTCKGIVSGVGIAKAPICNIFGGVNLSSSGASHPMPSCRFYYPMVTIKPELLIPYIENNRAKKVCYTSWLFNQYNGITSGSTFSNLVQSGIKACRGVWIIPFHSSITNGNINTTVLTNALTTFAQYQSPLDTAPATNGNFSLTNLQVSLGGVNVLNNVLSFTFENFLEQVAMYEKLSGADLGLSNGLISDTMWSQAYRFYYVDCSRSTLSDLMTTKQLNVSFVNNTNATLDLIFLIEKFSELVLDVESGAISSIQ
jgi:hypothetical protein